MAINHTRGPWSFDGRAVWAPHGGGDNIARDVAKVKREGDGTLIAEAPAMLAALRALLHQCEYIASESPEAMQHPDLLSARAILARIDGAAPAPAAPAPVAADKVGPMVQALELAEGFIAGFEDDETQEGVDWLLATIRAAIPATPTAQPAGAIGEAGGGIRGLLFDIRDFLAGFEDCEDNGELVRGLQERIARATEGEG